MYNKHIHNSLWPVEEHVDDQIPTFLQIEENEQTPVDEPGALLEALQGIRERVGVYVLLQLVQVLQSRVPTLNEDFSCELPPQNVEIVLQNKARKLTINWTIHFSMLY